jgi:SAM-dependent methyltransferase
MEQPYNHSVTIHNNIAPRQIAPVIIELIKPESVIDIGCGLGTFLRVFKEQGVKDIIGIDGVWCDKKLLFENIDPSEFIEKDLNQPFRLERLFDLVICLEVAEHLSQERAESFVEDLISLGDVILFSAAIPDQWGTNHLNEQWVSYWEEKFTNHDFVMHDILKPVFWEVDSIWWWYKQNMVIFSKKGYVFKNTLRLEKNVLKNVIHPELFRSRTVYLENILAGKSTVKFYIKLLIKGFLTKLGLKI